MLGRKNHLSLVIFHFSFAQVEVTSRKPLVDRKLIQYRDRSDRMPCSRGYRSLADSICGLLVLAIPHATWPCVREKVGLDRYGTASAATGCHTQFTLFST